MAKIVWEGNRKEFGTSHRSPPVPQHAIKIRDGEGLMKRAVPFGICPMMICMAAVVVKAYLNQEPPVSPVYLLPAFAVGFFLLPITMKPLLTICMVSAFMGLISPAPDYMDILSVLKKAPPRALICDSQDGLYAYLSENEAPSH